MKKIFSKYIFITGGVSSSLGKGISASAIACLLENQNLKVSLIKIDPYINIDAGTMSPYQHGEVYVTDDGSETDLDLGNYERFTNAKMSSINSVTTGQVYQSVIKRERLGEYSGGTVQVIPHITDEIKSRIIKVAENNLFDVILVEIGGTVGDIESIPFLEAIRQFSFDVNKLNTLYIHLTLIPFIQSADEHKTKPTQHSVKELRSLGIKPDILLCRTSRIMSEKMKDKLALFCDVDKEAVIQALDTKSIYEIPIQYDKEGLAKIVCQKLNLKNCTQKLNDWKNIIEIEKNPENIIEIGIIGKYVSLKDAYKSVYEAIHHGAIANKSQVKIKRIDSTKLNINNLAEHFFGLSGLLIPGGFDIRGVDGKILACTYGREHKIPTFGICLGFQCMLIEFVRNECGLSNANSTEFDKNTSYPIVNLLEREETIEYEKDKLRLGKFKINLIEKDSLAYKTYQSEIIYERHRHRYIFSNDYCSLFSSYNFVISGINKEKNIVEIMELKNHPWYIGVQFHPEFKSKPVSAHPLFKNYIKFCIQYHCKNNFSSN